MAALHTQLWIRSDLQRLVGVVCGQNFACTSLHTLPGVPGYYCSWYRCIVTQIQMDRNLIGTWIQRLGLYHLCVSSFLRYQMQHCIKSVVQMCEGMVATFIAMFAEVPVRACPLMVKTTTVFCAPKNKIVGPCESAPAIGLLPSHSCRD